MKHSIVIVDDHLLLSQGLSELINSFDNFEVKYLCKNGADFLEKIKFENNIPDIVLMDVNMPIMNGIETTTWLKDNKPEIKVLALSLEEHDNTIIKMLKAGARGYLLKDVEKHELEKALNELISNGFYHSNTVTNILLNSIGGNKEAVTFKDNEIKFMQLACSEMTYKEIADNMCLSPKTIDGYRDTLFEKLQIKNRTGLVVYAIKNKIYDMNQ